MASYLASRLPSLVSSLGCRDSHVNWAAPYSCFPCPLHWHLRPGPQGSQHPVEQPDGNPDRADQPGPWGGSQAGLPGGVLKDEQAPARRGGEGHCRQRDSICKGSAVGQGKGGGGVCGGSQHLDCSLGGVLVHFALPTCQCLEAGHRVCYTPHSWLQDHCPYSGMAPNFRDSKNMPGPTAVLDTPERGLPGDPLGPGSVVYWL